MFEQAARMKLRFDYRGAISVEDLWDLNQDDLNAIYGILSSIKKDSEGASLIDSKEDTVLTLRMDIVKHIF